MKTRFNSEEKDVVIGLYMQVVACVDQLPYTGDFDLLYEGLRNKLSSPISKNEFWRCLTNLRKAKELPRKAR